VVCGAHLYCSRREHAATFAVNAELVARQWQHCAWTVPLRPPMDAEHEAGQAASTVFQVFGMARSGIEPHLPGLVGRAQPVCCASVAAVSSGIN